ncbi:MAG: hypothetical protein HY064_12410 [Bacteroidetes bacterium]|nr:hypothetical protein [Bacteroidota bacterium]
MRIIFSVVFVCILSSCGTEGFFTPANDDSAFDSASKKKDPLAKEIMNGTGAVYPFIPDTLFDSLVIGSRTSFGKYLLRHGASLHKVNDSTAVTLCFSSDKSEWMQVWVIDKKTFEIPFSIVLQKTDDLPVPIFGERPEFIGKKKFVTGHGIYLGMPKSYLLNVYTDQKMKQEMKSDTLVLTYHPQKKDEQYYKDYDYSKVEVKFKFVNDNLRRMEYCIGQAELCKHENILMK